MKFNINLIFLIKIDISQHSNSENNIRQNSNGKFVVKIVSDCKGKQAYLYRKHGNIFF